MADSKFTSVDSWAFWNIPAGDLSDKDAKTIEDLFKDSYQENHFPSEMLPTNLEDYLQQTKAVIVGMNPGNAAANQSNESFLNFHGQKKSADYRLAAALYNTDLWGTFMTDLSTVIESDSTNVELDQKNVAALEKHLDELGIPEDAVLIALGGKTYKSLEKFAKRPVATMYHYSNANNGHWTAEKAKQQISEILTK